MKLLAMAMLLVGCSCGPTNTNRRTNPTPKHWTIVDAATIKVRASSSMYAVNPIDTNIQWTEPERGTFTLDCTAISVDDTNPDLLELGTCFVDKLRVNKLTICGVGGDTKCTVAMIRMYTTGAHAGFINTTAGYGVPFMSDGNEIGLSDANANSLSSYPIPANRRRVNLNHFDDTSYDLSIDMSNAGIGDYELDVTIELLFGG